MFSASILQVVLAFIIYGFSLGISLAIPGESGKVCATTFPACGVWSPFMCASRNLFVSNAAMRAVAGSVETATRVLCRIMLVQVITVTGAVGSGLVCYFIPIVNHFALYFKFARCMRQVCKIAPATLFVCMSISFFCRHIAAACLLVLLAQLI
jgi:hypothetical protein